MMKRINYRIEFYSYWHCGSGLSAGANVDALVVKDKNKLPYIPGKTLKGLIREALVDYLAFANLSEKEEIAKAAFGTEAAQKGSCFFQNAELAGQKEIVEQNLTEFLYTSLSSTAIDENGIAKDNSLRRVEVVIPCILYASIYGVPCEIASELKEALGLIKRLGSGRNRGLGRCRFSEVEILDNEKEVQNEIC